MAVEALAFVPALVLLILANYTEKKKKLRILTQLFLLLFVFFLVAEGAMVASGVGAELFDDPQLYGYGFILTGLLSLFIFLKPVRVWISRIISIDPDNWLHASALVFALFLAGTSLVTAFSVDIISLSKQLGLDTFSLVLQAVFFILLAFFGVGWVVRRDLRGALKRLGLVKPTSRDLALSLAFLSVLFVMMVGVGLLSLAIFPDYFDLSGDPTIEMIGGVTLLSALVIALGAGIGEEVLFRGAIQPRFGILPTSLLFTVAHIQYIDLSPTGAFKTFVQIGTLFGMSIVFGYERKMLNTTACVITHTLYDLILLWMVVL